jgi:hypothetical protein
MSSIPRLWYGGEPNSQVFRAYIQETRHLKVVVAVERVEDAREVMAIHTAFQRKPMNPDLRKIPSSGDYIYPLIYARVLLYISLVY